MSDIVRRITPMAYSFTTRRTTHGITVKLTAPSGRVQTKRFRNGPLTSAETNFRAWLDEQVELIQRPYLETGKPYPYIELDGTRICLMEG